MPQLRQLPKPARKGMVTVILPHGEPEREKIPGRVYITKDGRELPWVCEENPRMWIGQNEDED